MKKSTTVSAPSLVLQKEMASLIERGLIEDQEPWDWSGKLVPSVPAKAIIVAKSDGVYAGAAIVAGLRKILKDEVRTLVEKIRDGETYTVGQRLVEIHGDSRTLLAIERVFLNLLAFSSGIATQTNRSVEKLNKYWKFKEDAPRLTPTRKVLPYYRNLSFHAVLCGGGYLHRTNLSSGVLLKENHLRNGKSILECVREAKALAPHLLKIEVEVTDFNEFEMALDSKADAIMLDNFSTDLVKVCLKHLKKSDYRPIIEVSGGLNEESFLDYALPGVNIISMGSLIHSAKSADFSMLFTKK